MGSRVTICVGKAENEQWVSSILDIVYMMVEQGDPGGNETPHMFLRGPRGSREPWESSRHVKWPGGCLNGIKMAAMGNGDGTGARPNARHDVEVTDGLGP